MGALLLLSAQEGEKERIVMVGEIEPHRRMKERKEGKETGETGNTGETIAIGESRDKRN